MMFKGDMKMTRKQILKKLWSVKDHLFGFYQKIEIPGKPNVVDFGTNGGRRLLKEEERAHWQKVTTPPEIKEARKECIEKKDLSQFFEYKTLAALDIKAIKCQQTKENTTLIFKLGDDAKPTKINGKLCIRGLRGEKSSFEISRCIKVEDALKYSPSLFVDPADAKISECKRDIIIDSKNLCHEDIVQMKVTKFLTKDGAHEDEKVMKAMNKLLAEDTFFKEFNKTLMSKLPTTVVGIEVHFAVTNCMDKKAKLMTVFEIVRKEVAPLVKRYSSSLAVLTTGPSRNMGQEVEFESASCSSFNLTYEVQEMKDGKWSKSDIKLQNGAIDSKKFDHKKKY